MSPVQLMQASMDPLGEAPRPPEPLFSHWDTTYNTDSGVRPLDLPNPVSPNSRSLLHRNASDRMPAKDLPNRQSPRWIRTHCAPIPHNGQEGSSRRERQTGMAIVLLVLEEVHLEMKRTQCRLRH
jgi:hypothetical protein